MSLMSGILFLQKSRAHSTEKIRVSFRTVIKSAHDPEVTNELVRRGRTVQRTALLTVVLYADSHPKNGKGHLGFLPFLDISSQPC